MKKEYDNLQNQYIKYVLSKSKLKQKLAKKILFDFDIEYYPGDGFIILNVETTSSGLLDLCIDHIEKHGSLTEKEHKKYCV